MGEATPTLQGVYARLGAANTFTVPDSVALTIVGNAGPNFPAFMEFKRGAALMARIGDGGAAWFGAGANNQNSFGPTPPANALVGIGGDATALVSLKIKAAAGQTASLQEWVNSAAAVLLSITPAGLPKWDAAANQQTTVGAAGGASALPATPTKYLKIVDSAGTTLVVPAYAA